MNELNAVESFAQTIADLTLRLVLGATGTLGLLLVVGFVGVVAAMVIGELRAGRTHR